MCSIPFINCKLWNHSSGNPLEAYFIAPCPWTYYKYRHAVLYISRPPIFSMGWAPWWKIGRPLICALPHNLRHYQPLYGRIQYVKNKKIGRAVLWSRSVKTNHDLAKFQIWLLKWFESCFQLIWARFCFLWNAKIQAVQIASKSELWWCRGILDVQGYGIILGSIYWLRWKRDVLRLTWRRDFRLRRTVCLSSDLEQRCRSIRVDHDSKQLCF